jgi:hypothetical protein
MDQAMKRVETELTIMVFLRRGRRTAWQSKPDKGEFGPRTGSVHPVPGLYDVGIGKVLM